MEIQAGVYPLHAAAFLGRLDMVGLLLAHGAKVDSRDLEGHASLHMACIRGHVTVLQELLNAGADPDMTDVNGRNTLHFLARAGSIEVSETQLFWEPIRVGEGRGGGWLGVRLLPFSELIA